MERVSGSTSATFLAWRFYLIVCFIMILVFGLFLRVFNLAILKQQFLQQQSNERVLRLIKTPAFRGIISDRNGFPLAVSTSVFSIWMNPKEFLDHTTQLAELAKLLHANSKEIITLANQQKQKKREFVYLRRGIEPEVALQIKLLNIPGVYTQEEYRRYYPEGEIAAHVVGFTNIDDRGQEGLELGYNNWLQGETGRRWVIKDRLGRIISDVQTVTEQKAGRDLELSIDRRIQYLAYRELLTGILQNKARAGSAVVLDVKTGEILAIVNYPSFNPNNRPTQMSENIRNRALTDSFEPGSTIKAFTVASALESGKFKANAAIDTSPGWMRVDHDVVKDEKNNGVLTLAQILQLSSNMGAAKIVLELPQDQLWSLLHRVGFGEITGVGFPGEQNGLLVHHQPWGSFVLATLSFGYGMSVTALQLARAYAVLANDGVKLPVSLLKVMKQPSGERVLPTTVARQMLTLLETVTQKGMGKAAHVPGYRIAGKSGTAKKVGVGGYEKHHYTSSFVGIAPLSNPRFVVAVILHDPQGKKYYGALVAGPVFEKIMEGTLRTLDVAPDEVLGT